MATAKPKHKFHVGDRVMVRRDLEAGRYYEGVVCARDMAKYRGKYVTISRRHASIAYDIEEDGGYFAWTDEMFDISEPVNPRGTEISSEELFGMLGVL